MKHEPTIRLWLGLCRPRLDLDVNSPRRELDPYVGHVFSLFFVSSSYTKPTYLGSHAFSKPDIVEDQPLHKKHKTALLGRGRARSLLHSVAQMWLQRCACTTIVVPLLLTAWLRGGRASAEARRDFAAQTQHIHGKRHWAE